MRYVTARLDDALAAAIDHEMDRRGHRRAEQHVEAELLVVAIDEPVPGPSLLSTSSGAWQAMIDRVREVFRQVRDHMSRLEARGEGGRIVIVVDAPTSRPMEGGALAGIAGAFLRTMIEVAALDGAPSGIAVNGVVSGWRESSPRAIVDGIPVRRRADAADIARACSFLADPVDASFITGATLLVDGGWSITRTAGGNPFTEPTNTGETERYEN